MNVTDIVKLCEGGFSTYFDYIDTKYRKMIPNFFNTWKLFIIWIQKRQNRKDATQLVTEYEIYRTNRIFNRIQSLQQKSANKNK